MDACLRCNSQANGFCRKALTNWAIVTTCSHVFCRQCADQIGITNTAMGIRKCPACSTELRNEHDVVATNLKPNEEYKATVLSGLDPSTIVECAGKALAFWNYQMSEEIRYQEHFVKALTDKCGHFSNALDKVVDEGNAEINRLSNKVERMMMEKTELLQKNQEAIKMLRDKSKRYLTVQKLYDALKQKVQNEQQEGLVAVDAERTLESIGVISRPETYTGPYRAKDSQNSIDFHARNNVNQREGQTLYSHQRSGSINGTYNDFDANIMPPPSMKTARLDSALHSASTRRKSLVRSESARPSNTNLPIPILGSNSQSQHIRPTPVSHPRYYTQIDRNQGSNIRRGDEFPSAMKIGSTTDGPSYPAERHNGFF